MQAFLAQLLEHGKSNKNAFFFNYESYSYRWLLSYAQALKTFIEHTSINVTAFCCYNQPAVPVCYIGTWLAGTDALPINPRYKNQELINLLDQYRPDLIIIEKKRLNTSFEKFCLNHKIKVLVLDDRKLTNNFWAELAQYDSNIDQITDESMHQSVTYHLTSGSLGHIKAAAHTFEQISAYAFNRSRDLGYHDQDQLLIVLPLNHAFAFSYQLLPALINGLPFYMLAYFDAPTVLQHIIHTNITATALLPTMSYELAHYAQNHVRSLPPYLRYVLVAGDVLTDKFDRAFQKTFGVKLYQGIGMTEVFGYAQNTPEHYKAGATGRLFKQTKIKICDDNDHELPTGVIGHVFVCNEASACYYWQNPQLTQQTIKNGWIETGDLGMVDHERFFYFYGRRKNLIIKGGSNISPAEIESVLYKIDEIKQTAVVGQKDHVWGENIIAFVTCRFSGALTADAIYRKIRPILADYKLPDRILIKDKLPQNATGKIDRDLLKKQINAKSAIRIEHD